MLRFVPSLLALVLIPSFGVPTPVRTQDAPRRPLRRSRRAAMVRHPSSRPAERSSGRKRGEAMGLWGARGREFLLAACSTSKPVEPVDPFKPFTGQAVVWEGCNAQFVDEELEVLEPIFGQARVRYTVNPAELGRPGTRFGQLGRVAGASGRPDKAQRGYFSEPGWPRRGRSVHHRALRPYFRFCRKAQGYRDLPPLVQMAVAVLLLQLG
ncbi:hypothetical protein BH24DEI2_BH24DEI2_20280 [soil metagenome]